MLELFALVIYLAQQAGIMLGVGAETVLMVSFLFGLRAKPDMHALYVRASRAVEKAALALIVISGICAVFLHVLIGEIDVVLSPAFLFKWVIIGAVLVGYVLERMVEERGTALQTLVRGFVGGSWYALFIVHSIAPSVGWFILTGGYVAWMVIFYGVWTGFVFVMKRAPEHIVTMTLPKLATSPAIAVARIQPVIPSVPPITQPVKPKIEIKEPAPTPAPTAIAAPPAPKHVMPAPAPLHHAPLPAISHLELEKPHTPAAAPAPHPMASAAPVPPKHVPVPAPAPPIVAATPPAPPSDMVDLPAIRVMPRTPEEIINSNRPVSLEFNRA